MKPTPRVLSWLLVPLFLTMDGFGEHPTFRPKPGTVLSKHFAVETEFELDDMTLEMNGQDMTEMAGQIEIAMKIGQKLSVTDHYETLAGGRPIKLKRTYDQVASNSHVSGSNPQQGEEEKDIPLESELEGTSVVFAWDEADQSYKVSFDGDQKGDEELLEGLEENLDLRNLLPDHEVAKGDSWDLPAEAVRGFLAPGGDVKLRPTGETSPMGGMDQFSQNDLIGALQGAVEATYGGTLEEGESQLAVIQLKIKVRSAQDMTERFEQLQENMEGMPEGLEMDVSAFDGEYELEAAGELLWNLQEGHVHSLQVSGEARMLVDMSMSMSFGGQSQDVELSQTFTGSQTFTVTTGD